MAATKRLAGPAYLGSSVANIFNASSALISTLIQHIHIANVTSGVVTYTLYVGATAGSTGGTELAKGITIPANSVADLYWPAGLKLLSTDFLTGLASAGTSLVITVMGTQDVV